VVEFDELCPSTLSPIRFGDKWAGMIVRVLETGPRRFSEIKAPLRGVTGKVLTQSLRSLQRAGLVAHENAHYALTPLGSSMIEPMNAACEWAAKHWDELILARDGGPS
jgi:DNA-binding HxlR family transcriptional regulator